MYVNILAELEIRSLPNLTSEVIGLLKPLTEVNVIIEEDIFYEINGATGKWVYIDEPIEGWIFNGFLTKYKTQNATNFSRNYINLPNIRELILEYPNIVFGDTYELEAKIIYFIIDYYEEYGEILIERRGWETSTYYIYNLKLKNYTNFNHTDMSRFSPIFNNSRNLAISANDMQRHNGLIKIYEINNGVYTEILKQEIFINCIEKMYWINENELVIECSLFNEYLLVKRNGETFDLIYEKE